MRTFNDEDLDAVEHELLAAAVALNADGGMPDSGPGDARALRSARARWPSTRTPRRCTSAPPPRPS
ncbi:MAG: hypothetical protein ACLP0J_27605 [Solirubrobacteraceae bacterium]